MGKIYDSITSDLARWLGAQPMFFVATATPDPDTRVNVSPRGLDTGGDDFEKMLPLFPELPDGRAIIDVAVERIASSCGYGVPRMELLGPRERLLDSARRKGPEKLAQYRDRRNAHSIDGLPGLVPDQSARVERGPTPEKERLAVPATRSPEIGTSERRSQP